jgi:hypothetical protein
VGNPLEVLHNIYFSKADAAANCSGSRLVLAILSSMWSKELTGVLPSLQCTCVSVGKQERRIGPFETPNTFNFIAAHLWHITLSA